MSGELVFIKLGGSLITDKNQPSTPRLDVIERLAHEIADARVQDPHLKIVLGHGSGSFGHVPADRYHTRQGVKSAPEWQGFVEVWQQASALNHLIMQALEQARVPALAFPPMPAVTSRAGQVVAWDLYPLTTALAQNLMPVVQGDVVFDQALGGTILSTEDIFSHLASQLKPDRILLAGIEQGVWQDYPDNTQVVGEITPQTFPGIEGVLKGSAAIDVTGGMLDKVRQLLMVVSEQPGITACIFSGEVPGNVGRALLGEQPGTLIHV
jgi:isopentenyl phosphate kinase